MLYNHTINDTTQDYQINDFIGDLNKVYLATNRACSYLSIVTLLMKRLCDIIKLLMIPKIKEALNVLLFILNYLIKKKYASTNIPRTIL